MGSRVSPCWTVRRLANDPQHEIAAGAAIFGLTPHAHAEAHVLNLAGRPQRR